MNHKDFIAILFKAYYHFYLANPKNSYNQSQYFNYACFLIAKELGLNNILVYSGEVEAQDNLENYEGGYQKGKSYSHFILKIEERFYDFTLSQFDSCSTEPYAWSSLPSYFKNLSIPNYIPQKVSDNHFNQFHYFIKNEISRIRA